MFKKNQKNNEKEKKYEVKKMIRHASVKKAVSFIAYGLPVHEDLRFSLVFAFDSGNTQVIEINQAQTEALFGRLCFEFVGLYAGRPAMSLGFHKYIYDIDKKDTFDFDFLEWSWGTDDLANWNLNFFKQQGYNVNLNCGHVTNFGLIIHGVNNMERIGNIEYEFPIEIMKYVDIAMGIEYDKSRTKVVNILGEDEIFKTEDACRAYLKSINTPEKVQRDEELKRKMIDQKYYDADYKVRLN